MSDKSRLCAACGRYIIGVVVTTDDGPTHDCGELLSAIANLRAECDDLLNGLGSIAHAWKLEKAQGIALLLIEKYGKDGR